uniref:Aminopeptidase n=1 Tax=Syphacia muris TaxID=451379 RepID=A0A0N5B0I6_9BILA
EIQQKPVIKNANDPQLPDDIEVQDYYIRIQPYFPVDGIDIPFGSFSNFLLLTYLLVGRNLTFDGITTITFLVKADITSFVFHSYQLDYSMYELFDEDGNPLQISKIEFVENLQHIKITPTEKPVIGTLYTLHFIYTGIIHPYVDGGLYYTYYDDVQGSRHWMVSTHMENGVQARAVFPCIDQPSAKAIFHLTLIYPKTLVALGNQQELVPTAYNNQWNIARFLPSLRMSSYLVALAVGPFVSKKVYNEDGTLVRIWSWTGQEEYLEFAADVSSKCLHHMGLYTNITYPMTKSDQIGLPEFRAGAMENWGLVIYKYQYIAFNPKLHTTYAKQAAAKVMCHELAHQWFGNLVTAAWWSDLFLNEGFAAYFEIQSLKMALPEQTKFLEGKFLVETEQSGLNADALSASHPIYHNAVIFDDITYKKGPSLLRMTEFLLGSKAFQEGLRDYLSTYKYHNAEHNMLFEKLTTAARNNNVLDWCNNPINVTEFLSPWILQKSFPLITISGVNKTVTITQQPFNDIQSLSSSEYNYSWPIPLYKKSYNNIAKYQWLVPGLLNIQSLLSSQCSTENRCSSNNTYKCDNDQESATNSDDAIRWTMGNAEFRSFVRVDYDDVAFGNLLKHLNAKRDTDFGMNDKISLIADQIGLLQMRMAEKKQFSFQRLLDLLLIILPEYQHYSLFELSNDILLNLEAYYLDNLDYPLFKRFMEVLLTTNYNALNLTNTGDWDTDILRDYILPNAVRYDISTSNKDLSLLFEQFQNACVSTTTGIEECAKSKALNLFSSYYSFILNSFHPDIHRGIFCAGIRSAKDNNALKFLQKIYQQQIVNGLYFYQEYYAMLEGMACTQQLLDLQRLLKYLSLNYSFITRNPLGAEALFNYFVNNATDVFESESLTTYFNAMTKTWYSTKRLQQFTSLRDTVRSLVNNSTEADSIMSDQTQQLRSRKQFADMHLPAITKYLYDNFVHIQDESAINQPTFEHILPDFYSLHIRPFFPSSVHYLWYRNMTFEGTVKVNFTVLISTNVIQLGLHRLIVAKDDVTLNCGFCDEVEIDGLEKDYEKGLLNILISPKNLLVVNDICTLELKYIGFIADHPTPGITANYNYFEFSDKKTWIFATDFEWLRGIRSMVPSFDVPNLKTPWQIVLEHPSDMIPLSNMPQESTSANKNGSSSTTFMISPKISSFQVTVAVGHLASQEALLSNSNVVARVWAWTGMEIYANRALKVLTETLDYIDNLFQVHYPLPKIDVIALPQFWNGNATIDNFGIISGDYNLILEDPDYITTANRLDVTRTIAKATVKQLFNGYIGPKRFELEPLNNGISTFLSTSFIASTLEASQNDLQEFLYFVLTEKSFEFDENGNFSVIAPLKSVQLSYEAEYRSAAIFKMLDNIIGSEVLYNALQKLLQMEPFGTIDDESFANALKTAFDEKRSADNSANIEQNDALKMLDQFLKQKSYPVLKVECNDGEKLSYTVQSYHSNLEAQQWILPVYSQSESGTEFHVLTNANTEPFWSRTFNGNWQVENVERKSVFRVFYDDTVWNPIYQKLQSDPTVFDQLTVATLIADSAALQRKGMVPWSRVLDLSLVLKNEKRMVPWYSFLTVLNELIKRSYGTEFFDTVKNYARNILRPIYDQIAWNHSDNWVESLVASAVTEMSCKVDLDKCLSDASALFQEFISQCQYTHSGTGQCNQVHLDFRKTQYCYGLAINSEEINTIEKLYQWFVDESKYFTRDRDNLLYSLSCALVNDAERLIRKTVDGNFDAKFLNYLGQSTNGSEEMWKYFSANTLHVIYGSVDFDKYVGAMIQHWNSDNATKRIDDFLNSSSSEILSADNRKTLENVKIQINANREWLTTNFAPDSSLFKWLNEHNFNDPQTVVQ